MLKSKTQTQKKERMFNNIVGQILWGGGGGVVVSDMDFDIWNYIYNRLKETRLK